MITGKLGTEDKSTFESRLEYLNRPREWHEEHRAQLLRERQLAEFTLWATSWSNAVHAARERTQAGIDRAYARLCELYCVDAMDLEDTQEMAL